MIRNLATLICLGLAGWTLVGHWPFAPITAVVLALLGLSCVLHRPRSGFKRSYDQYLHEKKERRHA